MKTEECSEVQTKCGVGALWTKVKKRKKSKAKTLNLNGYFTMKSIKLWTYSCLKSRVTANV